MEEWLQTIKAGPQEELHPVEWAARLYADFEVIHPFPDGNGRTGRLVMNYLLILNGYPPGITGPENGMNTSPPAPPVRELLYLLHHKTAVSPQQKACSRFRICLRHGSP